MKEFLSAIGPDVSETFGELFDVFVYGHYTHREDTKEAKYRSWQTDVRGFLARKAAFLLALGSILWHVQAMRVVANELLQVTVENLCWQPPNILPVRRFDDGLKEPLFSLDIVSLHLSISTRVSKGDRVRLEEPLVFHLRNFLDQELGDRITSDNLGEIDVHEYGSKMGHQWIEKHVGARISFPVSWQTVEKSHANGTMIKHHVGKPSLFLTAAFFSHLQPTDHPNYNWRLVMTAG